MYTNNCGELQPLAATQRPFRPKGDFAGQTDGRTTSLREFISFLTMIYWVWTLSISLKESGIFFMVGVVAQSEQGNIRHCMLPCSDWATTRYGIFEWQVANRRQGAFLNDKCHTGSLQIRHNLCPRSAFCSLIIPETQARTKKLIHIHDYCSTLMNFHSDSHKGTVITDAVHWLTHTE